MEPGRGLNRTRWTEFIALLLFYFLPHGMPSDRFAHPCQSVTLWPTLTHPRVVTGMLANAIVASLSRVSPLSPTVPSITLRGIRSTGDSSSIGTVLRPGDHAITGEDSNVILSFEDMSTLMVKAESEVVQRAPPKGPSAIGLVFGKDLGQLQAYGKWRRPRCPHDRYGHWNKRDDGGFRADEDIIRNQSPEVVVPVTPRRGGAAVSVKAGQMVVTSAGKLSPVGSLNVAAETALWQPLLTAAGLSAPVATPQPQPSPGPTRATWRLASRRA